MALSALDARIIYDPKPDSARSTLRTVLAAWSAMPERATHHRVLQDDVETCPGFVDRVGTVVAAYPTAVLSR